MNDRINRQTLSSQKHAVVAANDCRYVVDTTAGLGDTVTSDLLTGITADIDKSLRFLEAHLAA